MSVKVNYKFFIISKYSWYKNTSCIDINDEIISSITRYNLMGIILVITWNAQAVNLGQHILFLKVIYLSDTCITSLKLQ